MSRVPSILQGLPDDLLDSDKPYYRALKMDAPRTAFGELQAESVTPLTQVSAQYGTPVGVQYFADSGGSGTNEIVDGKFSCDSGSAPISIASILTKKQLAYRSGQGAIARFTALFDPGVAGNYQEAGLITAENSLTFGWEQDKFGITHSQGGRDELQELTLTSPAAGAAAVTVTVDGITYSVNLTGTGTLWGDAFEISESLSQQVPNYRFTSNDGQVVAQAVFPDVQDAFDYVGANGSTGVWVQLVDGIGSTRTFYPQTEWNRHTAPWLDPSKGNVYQVQFQYLGFGAIDFFIENPENGRFKLVHSIEFANKHDTPSVSNPIFRLGWLTSNVGNTTPKKVQGTSAMGGVQGSVQYDSNPRAASNEQLSVGSTLTNILSVRNRIAFGDKVNRIDLIPTIASLASQTNKAAFFKIIINPTYSSPVNFEYTNKTESISEIAKDFVVVTGGEEIGSITVVAGSPATVNLPPDSIQSGDVICIAAQMTSGQAADCQASLIWQEDL